METFIDFDDAPIFAIPLREPYRGVAVREGMLIEGPQGWGEFSPPPDCTALADARWLTAAVEAGTVGWPDPVRGRVPVAVAVPAVDAARARAITAASGCRSADVRLASGPDALGENITRLEAVRDALGPGGSVRCGLDGVWDVETAAAAIPQLDRAAGGLEFVEQPCATLAELAAVRRRVQVRIAAGESIRAAADPMRLPLAAAVDIAVLAVGPLGGVRRALRVAESCGLPCVVSSTLETTIGVSGGLALAGTLPETGLAGGLATVPLLTADLVSEARSLIPSDGFLPVAPMPPAPDAALLQRFSVTDPVLAGRWRERLHAARTLL